MPWGSDGIAAQYHCQIVGRFIATGQAQVETLKATPGHGAANCLQAAALLQQATHTEPFFYAVEQFHASIIRLNSSSPITFTPSSSAFARLAGPMSAPASTTTPSASTQKATPAASCATTGAPV